MMLTEEALEEGRVSTHEAGGESLYKLEMQQKKKKKGRMFIISLLKEHEKKPDEICILETKNQTQKQTPTPPRFTPHLTTPSSAPFLSWRIPGLALTPPSSLLLFNKPSFSWL